MRQITGLSNIEAESGGASVSFKMEFDDRTVEQVVIPAVDIGHVLAFFAGAAEIAGREMPNGAPTNDLVLVPASGIGFQDGSTPDTTVMVVSVSGFGIGFELDSTALADTAQRFAQTTLTLSASQKKLQ